METFVPLNLPPGLAKNGTVYQNRNRWINGNLIRFYEGTIRPVGGWSLARTTADAEVQVAGKPRCSYAWRKNDGTTWLSVGTVGTATTKLYAFSGGVLTDITPGGLVDGSADGFVSSGVGMYGAGVYGAGIYGGGSLAGTIIDADTWSLDNFGEALVACLTSDGKVYSSIPTAAATQVTNSPTGVRAVFVTGERFLTALGTTADPRAVTWASQETLTTWAPAAANSAGDFTLQTGGRPMAGRRTDRENLIWTDADLWSMSYIGGTFIYAFNRKGDNCGLIGPNAAAIGPDGTAFWMGSGQFFSYTGAVRPLECDVADYVFGDLNMSQRAKITAMPVAQFGEVWWFYPSSGSLENDRYVNVNYRTGAWTVGNLARAAAVGAGVFANPLAWTSGGKLYTHETGTARDGVPAYLESGPLELGDGDRILRLQSLMPDERTLGQVSASFYTSFSPTQAETLAGPYLLSSLTDVRVSGRQFRLRLAEPITGSGLTADSTLISADTTSVSADGGPASGTDFRVGRFRVGAIPGGRR